MPQLTADAALYYLGVAAAFVLSSGIIGTVTVLLLKRFFEQKDKEDVVHITNQGKLIDQDVTAFQMMSVRLTKLEEWYKELQEKLSSQMEQNARLGVENKFLKEKLENVEKESKERLGRIRDLEAKVEDLQKQIDELLQIQRGEL